MSPSGFKVMGLMSGSRQQKSGHAQVSAQCSPLTQFNWSLWHFCSLGDGIHFNRVNLEKTVFNAQLCVL